MTRRTRNPRQLPPERELSEAQRARLASCPTSPWGRDAEVEDEAHRVALLMLFEACGGRGLPMPGGFLLDPHRIAERLAPRPRLYAWQVLLGYHPLIGLLVGGGGGGAGRRSIDPSPRGWTTRDPTYGLERPVARSWPELIDYLFAVGDALARAHVLWVRIGERRAMGERDARRWSRHRHALEARSVRRFARLAEALGVQDAFAHGVASVKVDARNATTVIALDDEALVASDDADAIERALRVISRAGELAVPHAFGGYRDGGRPEAPARGLCYAFPGDDAPDEDASGVRLPRHRVLATRDAHAFDWLWAQDGRVNVARRVEPGRSPAGAAPCLAGASARLHRALARRGAFIAEPLRSVEGVRAWLDEQGHEGWDVLGDIEARVGGLVLAPAFGLLEPDRLGPFAMLVDRASLEPLGLNAPVERDLADGSTHASDLGPRDWPFVCREGIELAVVGYENPRIDSAVCADAAGTLYVLDHEFDELTPRASDALVMLEKLALWTELHDERRGVAAEPAFALSLDLGDEVARGLGLARAAEASDRVSSTYLASGVALLLRHAHPLRPARTDVYASDPERAVALARGVRDAFADVTLHVRVGTSAAGAARRAAFVAARLPGNVEWTTAQGWSRLFSS